MKTLFRVFLSATFILVCILKVSAWEGMPTPPLHVEGNKLKDPTGNNVLLHGWMQPTASWFNGEGRQYHDPTDWTNPDNIAGMLNFLKEEATVMSDTSPRYGQDHGWYASFVRLNTDAIGGWTQESGLVSTTQFNAWIDNFVVPYAEFLSSRGLYLVISAVGPINTPNNGTRNAGVVEQQRLRTFWSTVANAPGVKNADNIMFELMNEPVDIESSPGNGDWGNHEDKYFEAFTKWMQPVIDDIRNTGAENVIWVPTLEWQGTPYQWDRFPFSGSNIGVACHYYPSYGGVFDNPEAVQDLWDKQYKPAADRWPMMITELFWTPYPNDPWNLVNGSTAGFGNAIKKAMDNQGNVSYIVGFIGDLIENLNQSRPQNCHLSQREGAQSYFKWLPTYTWAAPDDGTPKYEYAVVEDENPKQIKMHVKHAIKSEDTFNGFSVFVDNQLAEIKSIALGDTTNVLVITLNDSVQPENKIEISYADGNVASVFEKAMINFSNTTVYNMLEGASPFITKLQTNFNGDTLKATFSQKMLPPSDLSLLSLGTHYNDGISIPITQSLVCESDSTVLYFLLGKKVFAEYKLTFSCPENSLESSYSSFISEVSNVQVSNNSQGLPVQIEAGRLEADGFSVVLEFSKPLNAAHGQSEQFELSVNGKTEAIKDFLISENTIRFSTVRTLHYGAELLLSYTPGTIKATDQGPLEAFTDYSITNKVEEPSWQVIPAKIEAEDYTLQSGTDLEQTGDTGGGENVAWIDSGDWIEFAINNAGSDSSFEITFRVAAPNNDCELEYYIDDEKIGSVSVPNTGNWQVWQSVVVNDVTIEPGNHYLKLVFVKGGFNINYIDVKQLDTSVETLTERQMLIYPNPASSNVNIESPDFKFSKVEIFNMAGKKVSQKFFDDRSMLQMPVRLRDGMYVLKISNEMESVFRKIVIDNKQQ